jgi:hypothetical protein
MPVDWDDFMNVIDERIDNAAGRTDDRLASRISSVSRLTDEEVKGMFPESADVKKLAELMKIVNGAQRRNTKINQIVRNSEKFAGIILTLLKKFA